MKFIQDIAKVNYKTIKKPRRNSYKANGFEIEGLEELIEAFKELPEDAIYKLSDPSTNAAKLVCARAVSKINDKTGQLGISLTVRKPGKQKNKKAYKIFASVGIGKGAMYGVPLELGHKLVYFGQPTAQKVEEKPYMRPAADESKDEVGNIMANAMKKVIDEMGGKQ